VTLHTEGLYSSSKNCYFHHELTIHSGRKRVLIYFLIFLISKALSFTVFRSSSSASGWVAADYLLPLKNRSFSFIPFVEPWQYKIRLIKHPSGIDVNSPDATDFHSKTWQQNIHPNYLQFLLSLKITGGIDQSEERNELKLTLWNYWHSESSAGTKSTWKTKKVYQNSLLYIKW
jgi:hypothetical protein